MISVSGGREWRERLEPVPEAAPVDFCEPVLVTLGVRRDVRGASSSTASRSSAAFARVARAVAPRVLRRGLVLAPVGVAGATSSGASAVDSASFGVARLAAAPRYHRTMPTRSTVAEVKNISGKRSISGYPQLINVSLMPVNVLPWNTKYAKGTATNRISGGWMTAVKTPD
jgi:hypothetical protein